MAAFAGMLGSSALATVTLHSLFTDHMVLQREAKVPVWGTAAPGEGVSVRLGKAQALAKAGADGKWMAYLPPMKAGGPFELTVTGQNTITLTDVYVGEVWLASGQSNMAVGVGDAINGQQEIANADHPLIRMFNAPMTVASTPQERVAGTWQVCTPQAAPGFSACAYFFALNLQQKLNIPIGIVHSSVSGTWAECWTSIDVLRADPILSPLVDRFSANEAAYKAALKDYQDKMAAWVAAGKPAGGEPKAVGVNPDTDFSRVSGLYNGMIAPLMPFRIRGAIWWQGEYNAPRAWQYRTLFPAMIRDWRTRWGQGDFPFYFVQLENFIIPPGDTAHYDELREAQGMTLSVPSTGMATCADIGEWDNVHPHNKQEVGRRLALIALAQVYGNKDLVYSGPLFKAMAVKDGKATISFAHVDGGLVSKSGELLGSFVIAGEDKQFHPAQAKIDGETVVVSSPDVAVPVAVRYAFEDNPTCTLYNKAGRPAFPFRTDDWPVHTTGLM
jgi:sialate O-acetylesterase